MRARVEREIAPPTHQAPATHSGGFTHGKETMADAEAIARAGYKLAAQLDTLENIKTSKGKPSEARVMKPGFGPQDPGNGHAMNIDWEVWVEIRSWCVSLNEIVQSQSIPPFSAPTSDYGRWVGMNGTRIAEDLDADTFLEEIARWSKSVEQVTGSEGREPSEEPWQLAPVIIQMVGKLGATITRKDLTDFAARGYVQCQKRMTKNGWRNTYLLSQVLKHLDNGRSSSTYWRTAQPML